MSRSGAAPRAGVSVSNARAEASRRNGARSRWPNLAPGQAWVVGDKSTRRLPFEHAGGAVWEIEQDQPRILVPGLRI